jgi:hypothetical protein
MSLSLGLRWPLVVVVVLVAAVFALLVGALGYVSVAEAVGNCPNEGFRIGPSAGLPDCRAYEMVSPPDKNGGEVDGGVRLTATAAPEQAAADGEAVTYGSSAAFIGTEPLSAMTTSQYLSRRTAGGWQTRAIVPTQQVPGGKVALLGGANPEYSLFQGFSEDLSSGFLLAWTPQPDPAAPADYYNPYLFEGASGGYRLLSEVTPPEQPPGLPDLFEKGFGVEYAGMSADGRHVIFAANDALTPEAIPGRVNLYEWSAGMPLELVSVLPEGRGVDLSGAAHVLEGGLHFGSAGNFSLASPSNFSGALSNNGMRAFWTGSGNQIYMHEITGAGPRTVEVSASQKSGVPSGGGAALYWTANTEGSLVYFTSAEQLTDDSTAQPGGNDLYQYDVNTGVLSDLSVDLNVGETAGVQGVLGMGESEGVPYVYFVAHGQLAAGAAAGADNLYVSRGGALKFIGTLGETEDFANPVMERTARAAPGGNLAFQSAEPLTGYDNLPANGKQCPPPVRELTQTTSQNSYKSTFGGRCLEVFEYEAHSGRLVCVSCDPRGLPPTADSLIPETSHLYANVQGWESTTVQQRYLLDDGRVFFQSEDALLAQASDGRQNVYEYEPEGVGQCAASGAGGCLYLISTGESSGQSYFLDASADGRDVFFVTSEQLVPQDGDGATDVYDAREGGGFSSAVAPPCSGEACKPAVTPAPAIYGAPSSATFQGAGNISAQPTAKPVAARKKAKKKSSKKTRPRLKGRARKVSAGKSGRRSERGRR